MTVIVWDLKTRTLVSDRQTTAGGQRQTTTKIFKHKNELIAMSGDDSFGRRLVEWYCAGSISDQFPFKVNENEQSIYVFDGTLQIRQYVSCYMPSIAEMEQYSAGSGRDYAMGALYMGATPVEAAHAACNFDCYCGQGLDILRL